MSVEILLSCSGILYLNELLSGLCDETDRVDFKPYAGDCTKYVQCFEVDGEVKAFIRTCPFGMFWDIDSIICRRFLVNSPSDTCRTAVEGFTYGMAEYGCRFYWKCLGGKSVSRWCAFGSRYVEGLGCMDDRSCIEKCQIRERFAESHD